MKIDINRIHQFHEAHCGLRDFPSRGKTTYIHSLILGCIQVLEYETVYLIVEDESHLKYHVQALASFVRSQGVKLDTWCKMSNRLYFKDSDELMIRCNVKILTKYDVLERGKLDGIHSLNIFSDVIELSDRLDIRIDLCKSRLRRPMGDSPTWDGWPSRFSSDRYLSWTSGIWSND